jgi:hypothetical protein
VVASAAFLSAVVVLFVTEVVATLFHATTTAFASTTSVVGLFLVRLFVFIAIIIKLQIIICHPSMPLLALSR